MTASAIPMTDSTVTGNTAMDVLENRAARWALCPKPDAAAGDYGEFDGAKSLPQVQVLTEKAIL